MNSLPENTRFDRRRFLSATLAALPVMPWVVAQSHAQGASGVHFSVAEFDRDRILAGAEKAAAEKDVSLADAKAPAQQAVPGRYYSEQVSPASAGTDSSDNPELPTFKAHTELLLRMNDRVGLFTAAWRLTREDRYLAAACSQLRAWCLDPKTRMLPDLDGSGIRRDRPGDPRDNGLTETACLAETARATAFLLAAEPASTENKAAVGFSTQERDGIHTWFGDLLTWFRTSKKGSIARETKDIQAICWTMQAAEFARLTRNDDGSRECTHIFRERLLRLMTLDGNFAFALGSPDPYAQSMFTLECLGAVAEIISTPFDNLWRFTLPDGRGMRSVVAWAYPYLEKRSAWPYRSDRHGFRAGALRQNALLFAARAFDRPEYAETWKKLSANLSDTEARLLHPIVQPSLWTIRPPA